MPEGAPAGPAKKRPRFHGAAVRARCLGGEGYSLGGALEPFLESGALDDLVTVAEAATDSRLPVFVPEARDLVLDLGVLGGDSRVVAFGEDVQQLSAPIRGAVDLELDVFDCLHASKNVQTGQVIPGRGP